MSGIAACFYGLDSNNTDILYKVCPKSTEIMTNSNPSQSVFDEYATAQDMDYVWVLLAGALVFFMQTGFTLLEAGMVKHTNVQNILFKNMMDACIGTMSFFLFGYCFAYGDESLSNGFIGIGDEVVLLSKDYNAFFFQWAFAATAATIVSGAVAERCVLISYFIYTLGLTMFVYPIVVHWMWSSTGWLSPFNEDITAIKGGVIDFAGSGVVHMVGGWSGLCGAVFLGPRYLRFDDSGQRSSTLNRQFKFGHNVPFQVLGTFILWFGWYGFNPGSTLAANGAMELASKCAVNTTLAAAGGGISVALIERLSGGLEAGIWMIPAICNGILAGLVSVTAPCAVIKPWTAILIGVIGGCIYWCSSTLVEKMKVDDPLDAFSVHGVCGFWGVVSVGVFAYDKEDIAFAGYSQSVVELNQGYRLGIQVLAAVVIAAWTVTCSSVIFGTLRLIKKGDYLKISDEEQKKGLDQLEHGGKGYSMARTYSVKPSSVLSKEEIQRLRNELH